MKNYKLAVGNYKLYKITDREDFELKTKNSDNYFYIGVDGIKRGLAVCPSCDNPIRILGLYKPLKNKEPYAEHHNKSTILAKFDSDNYKHCPFSFPNSNRKFDISSKKNCPSPLEKELYYTMRNNFDKAIYLLNRELDFYISFDFAAKLLSNFVKNKAYYDYKATYHNLPWILIDNINAFSLIGRLIKRNSDLWTFLTKRNDVKLVDCDKNGYDIIQPVGDSFVTLKACFMAIKRKIDNSDNLDEKITFGITDSEKVPANWIYKKKYKIDEFYFHNLCKQTENRNQKFLELSKQIMPEI